MRSGEIPVFALAVVFALAFLIFHSRRESASAFAFSKRQRRALYQRGAKPLVRAPQIQGLKKLLKNSTLEGAWLQPCHKTQ